MSSENSYDVQSLPPLLTPLLQASTAAEFWQVLSNPAAKYGSTDSAILMTASLDSALDILISQKSDFLLSEDSLVGQFLPVLESWFRSLIEAADVRPGRLDRIRIVSVNSPIVAEFLVYGCVPRLFQEMADAPNPFFVPRDLQSTFRLIQLLVRESSTHLTRSCYHAGGILKVLVEHGRSILEIQSSRYYGPVRRSSAASRCFDEALIALLKIFESMAGDGNARYHFREVLLTDADDDSKPAKDINFMSFLVDVLDLQSTRWSVDVTPPAEILYLIFSIIEKFSTGTDLKMKNMFLANTELITAFEDIFPMVDNVGVLRRICSCLRGLMYGYTSSYNNLATKTFTRSSFVESFKKIYRLGPLDLGFDDFNGLVHKFENWDSGTLR